MDTEKKEVNSYDVIGISEERADEIIKAFKHARIDAEYLEDLFVKGKEAANLQTVEEGIFAGWAFRIMYDEDNNPTEDFLRNLFKK